MSHHLIGTTYAGHLIVDVQDEGNGEFSLDLDDGSVEVLSVDELAFQTDEARFGPDDTPPFRSA